MPTALVAAAVWGAACLPDLEVAPRAPPSPVATVQCGDGRIAFEVDAGEECDPGDAGPTPGCTTACLHACEGLYDRQTGHCYFTEAPASYASAGKACAARGAHVVTLRDEGERALVTKLTSGARYWVGLARDVASGGYAAARSREPGYAPACPGCYARALPDAGGFRVSDAGPGDCVADEEGADVFALDDCARPLVTVCERELDGEASDLCTGGYCVRVPPTRSDKRYLYVPAAATADEATLGCEALGGHLALFDSAAEREAVLAEAQRVAERQRGQRLGPEEAWVGLAGDGGTFAWDDGKPEALRPPVWGVGEPRGKGRAAVLLLPPGTVVDVAVQLARVASPDERRPYLCQY